MKPLGVEMRDFCLNLATSDPLELFVPEEMKIEGNIFHGPLPTAWLAATLCMGSVYLYYDMHHSIHLSLQHRRLSHARTRLESLPCFSSIWNATMTSWTFLGDIFLLFIVKADQLNDSQEINVIQH